MGNVQWGIWCYADDGQGDWQDLEHFEQKWMDVGARHGIKFDKPQFEPQWGRLDHNWGQPKDLQTLREQLKELGTSVHILFVLLPKKEDRTDKFYKQLKTITETELHCFPTQCLICPT